MNTQLPNIKLPRDEKQATSRTETILKRVVIVIAILVAAVGGWMWFRWSVGMDVFDGLRAYLRQELGLSQSLATTLALIGGIGGFAFASVVAIGTRSLAVVMLAIVVFGIPLSFLNDYLADRVCLRHDTGEQLCEVWRTADGYCQIRRKDAGAPPKGWEFVRVASREDVKACSANPEEQEKNKPRELKVESCDSMPQFFDAAGQPRVYWIRKREKYELWDRAGHHPVSGLPLQPMTMEVVEKICEQLERDKKQQDAMTREAELEWQRQEQARVELERQAQEQRQAQERRERDEQERRERERLNQARLEAKPQEEVHQQPQSAKTTSDPYSGIRIR